jgi:DNA-binding transcriptional regulator YiaG
MALPTNPMELILHAQRALRLNNRTLGEYLGVSKRTVQRWWVAGSGPTPWHLQRLAVDILPTNP